ncbi:trafficking protein particle complex subunit 9 [Lepeophtheirus salmonis]|uniref:trafficking protein particle complex subunit 9 n=1 Tax=Lepeophtheirus salmonis TaxID=72036 RepID=UPI003AF3CD13
MTLYNHQYSQIESKYFIIQNLDHGRISVLLRSLSESYPKDFDINELVDDEYPCNDDRIGRLRWISGNYPLENNSWGDFQVHRAILGLVSFGVAETLNEFNELLKLHNIIQVKYSDTLIDSRLIVIGWPPDTSKSPPNPDGHTQILFYDSDIRERISEFVKALIVVLEFRRRNRAIEKQEKLPLYCAPFEKKDFVGLDMESRVNKRRIYGRCQKYIADLSLLCGSYSDAFIHYEAAADVLKSCHDWLWLANSYEGLCVTSTIVLNQKLHKKALSTPEIIEKYKEIVMHYSKYKHAGIIEIESSIKAVHVLRDVKNYLLASEFLQNIVFINLPMNDAEKIERFSALSRLYWDIGFKRKAAFFNRVAAMRCVAPQNPVPQWSLCYQLLCKTVNGYLLEEIVEIPSKSSNEVSNAKRGWPSLQVQILQELVGTARRMGNIYASINHMVLLIETFFDKLTPKERVDFCHQLSVLLKHYYEENQDTPITGISIYRVPRVDSFTVKPPSSHHIPVKIVDTDSIVNGPFLFTPIVSASRSSSLNKKNKRIQWVQYEVCEVEFTIFNPLGVELKVTDLRLEFDSVDFETFGSTFSLPPFSGPHIITLMSKPHGVGKLRIQGYSCSVFGLRSICSLSHCRLKSNFTEEENENGELVVIVEVLPSLPLMKMSLESTTSTSSSIYWGETLEINIIFDNIGSRPVDEINLTSISLSTSSDSNSNFIIFNENSNIADALDLPLSPVASLTYKVDILFRGMNEIFMNGIRLPAKSLNQSSYHNMTLSVTVAYSSSGDEYRRSSTEKINFTLNPSANAIGADVLRGDEDPRMCYLVLDVRNLTKLEMDLLLEPNKVLIIEPLNVCRVPVYIPKLKQPITEARISEYLSNNTSIKWNITEQNRSGWVSISDVQLSPEMIKSLSLSPITVELYESNNLNVSCTSLECSLGGTNNLILIIKNNSDDGQEIFISELNVSCKTLSKSDGLTISRPRRRWNSKLDHNSSFEHELYILPLIPGNYDLRVSCEYKVSDSDDVKCDKYFKMISLLIRS